MKVKSMIITGAQGQLGATAHRYFVEQGWIVHAFAHEDLDITNLETTQQTIEEIQPSLLFNAAAYTNVEAAESNSELAYKVNVVGVKNLVTSCNKAKTKLLHISSDYVFDGTSHSPYTEDSLLNPINEYGKTKALADTHIQSHSKDYLILRSSWIYSAIGHNFMLTMLNLAEKLNKSNTPLRVVNDQTGTPTSTYQIVCYADNLLSRSARGLFNCTADGSTTWYGFAQEIFKKSLHADIQLEPCKSEEYPQKAQRPPFSVLSLQKIKALGIETAPWQDALSRELSILYER